MAQISIRNLPDATHRALRVRAARNGRSTEAEARAILTEAVAPTLHVRLGSLLAQVGQAAGGVDLDIRRDTTPAVPPRFE